MPDFLYFPIDLSISRGVKDSGCGKRGSGWCNGSCGVDFLCRSDRSRLRRDSGRVRRGRVRRYHLSGAPEWMRPGTPATKTVGIQKGKRVQRLQDGIGQLVADAGKVALDVVGEVSQYGGDAEAQQGGDQGVLDH